MTGNRCKSIIINQRLLFACDSKDLALCGVKLHVVVLRPTIQN